MAEGWARALLPPNIQPFSAGIEPHGLNPRAVQVMAETGVDISAQRSKHLSEFADIPFDYVITLCGHAQETCPLFPGHTRILHVGFDDPPALARSARTENEALAHYRRVRDEISDWIKTLPRTLLESPA
jgi:arsenate reductase